MFDPNPSDSGGPRQSGRGPDPVALIYLLAAGHATCLLVFARRRFGSEAFYPSGVVAIALIITYGSLSGSYGMWRFLAVWLATLVVRRAECGWDYLRGRAQHSRYGGWPWLAMRVPLVRREATARHAVEPLLCLFAGAALSPLSPALGLFVAAGIFSLTIKAGIERWLFEARLRAMRDAAIEHRQLADAFGDGGL